MEFLGERRKLWPKIGWDRLGLESNKRKGKRGGKGRAREKRREREKDRVREKERKNEKKREENKLYR